MKIRLFQGNTETFIKNITLPTNIAETEICMIWGICPLPRRDNNERR